MIRRSRPLTALLAAFALVFAQVAVSAHACEETNAAAAPEVAAHHVSCHEMVPDSQPATGNVCVEHCQYGDASVDSGQPDAMAADLAGPFLRVEVAQPAGLADSRSSRRLPPTAAPPPPAILFGVLRI